MLILPMFSGAVGLLLLMLLFRADNTVDAAMIEALAPLPCVPALPPPCPSFGDGGLDFFRPSNYAEFVRCHNERYFATHHRPRPLHVLFEASGKTELGVAFGLMTALASQPEKYKVTYLSPGGTIVRRKVSGSSVPKDVDHATKTWILGPKERPAEHDTVLYEAAFSSKKNEDLKNSGIHVVLKSMLSAFDISAEDRARMLEEDSEYKCSELPGDNEEMNKMSGEEIWIQTLRSGVVQNPVDFVVADCCGHPRSAKLLMARAQVPGASWCGNLENFFEHILEPAQRDVYEVINNQVSDQRFRGAELTPVFSAHFLGWGAEEKQPISIKGLILEDEPVNVNGRGRAQGPTRALMLGLGQNSNLFRYHGLTGPIFEQEGGFKIPISLVSNLPTASCTASLTEEGKEFLAIGRSPEHEEAPRGPESEVAAPAEIKAIRAKMDELGATRLIYIAFGSQGFFFKKAAYKQIIEEAAAVDNAVVFFVIPPASDWEHSPPYPYQPDRWRADYYSARVAGEALLTLPKNVLLSTWAPQKPIFEQFPGPNTVFLTHGGVGSLSEGIVNNIALACFALAFDQPRNCDLASRNAVAVDLRPFSKKMVLGPDKTIEGPPLVSKPPSEDSMSGDSSPDAGNTIRERIEHIFRAESEQAENENKFQKALAECAEDLKTAAYAQDTVVGAFENTMEQQLRLYEELGLFDGRRDRGNYVEEAEEGGEEDHSVTDTTCS